MMHAPLQDHQMDHSHRLKASLLSLPFRPRLTTLPPPSPPSPLSTPPQKLSFSSSASSLSSYTPSQRHQDNNRQQQKAGRQADRHTDIHTAGQTNRRAGRHSIDREFSFSTGRFCVPASLPVENSHQDFKAFLGGGRKNSSRPIGRRKLNHHSP